MTNGYVNLPQGLIDKIAQAIGSNVNPLIFTDRKLAIELHNCLSSGKPAIGLYIGKLVQQTVKISVPFSYISSDTSYVSILVGIVPAEEGPVRVNILMAGDVFTIGKNYM